VQAVTEIGSLSAVSAAVQFYKAKHTPLVEKLVADVVAELIENKKATGKGTRHITGLKFRLGKFTEAFQCNISDVTSAQIQSWLENQKTSANSYQNNRGAIHLLFNFALHKHRRYVRENVVVDVENRDVPPKDVEVFTPEEAQRLLANVKEDFLPCLAIGLFAGIRGSEIQRLTWEDVYLQRPARERQIFVKAKNAKTGDSRNTPLTENLVAWLAPYAERKGKIWSHSIATYITRLRETSQAAGIKWKKNGLRDSFISYACAITKDIGRVADMSGNSPAVIRKHYLKLVSEADAEKFFRIFPPKLASDSVPPLLENVSQPTADFISIADRIFT
jgi:integrase